MSTTVLRFNEQTQLFNQLDLMVVACLSMAVIRARHPELDVVRAQWDDAVRFHAPGVLELSLDEPATKPALREKLIAVFRDVESDLLACGDTVPLARIRADCKVSGVHFERPYPTRHLLLTVRGLLQLLGHVDPRSPSQQP